MDGPVTLLLVVSLAGGEAQLGQLRATLAAQLDPRQVQLSVRRADGVAELDRMLDAAAQDGPVALVSNPRRGAFELRVALKPGQWARRTFRFAAQDPVRERNRTVALAIASMTPEWRRPEPLPEAEPEPEPETPAVPRLGEPEPVVEVADAGAPPPAPEPVDAGAPPIPPIAEPVDAGAELPPQVVSPPEPVPAVRLAGAQLEVGALGGTWPLAAGGHVGVHYCWPALCAGLAVRGERAEVPAASAEVIHASALAIARAQTWVVGERVGVAVQVGAGPGWVRAERRGQAHDRWLLDLELAPEAWVRVAEPVSVFLRVGLGVSSGPTPIYVNGQQVSELPVARAQLILGLRVGR